MKSLNVRVGEKEYLVNIPTKVEEITKEYMLEVTNLLNIAPNYSLIGIVSIEEFAAALNPSKRDLAKPIMGVPVFVRAGHTDDEFINSITAGQTIIVGDGDLSIGHHINSPYNKLTMPYISSLCKQDANIRDNAFKLNEKCCFLSFKLVPNNAIHGAINEDNKPTNVDPYVLIKSISC